jgi:hypothetical protein
MPNHFFVFLRCLILCWHSKRPSVGPEPGVSDALNKRDRMVISKRDGNLDDSMTGWSFCEPELMNDVGSDLPFNTLPPPVSPRGLSNQTLVPPRETIPKGCKCGTTERYLFPVPEFRTEPDIWLTITWIPCPVHPCRHSQPQDLEGPLLGSESSDTLSIGEGRCLCNIHNQMLADPVSSKQWYDEQCSSEFPAWGYPRRPVW